MIKVKSLCFIKVYNEKNKYFPSKYIKIQLKTTLRKITLAELYLQPLKSHLKGVLYKLCKKKTTCLSYDVASGSEIMPCIKIDKPQVVYRFSAKVMK